jgi:hypothetical protein
LLRSSFFDVMVLNSEYLRTVEGIGTGTVRYSTRYTSLVPGTFALSEHLLTRVD